MSDLYSYGPKNIREFVRTNLVAILCTIILHLLVAIVLVQLKVGGLKEDHELGVMLDFSEEKTLEDLLNEENIVVPPEWIEQVFEARQAASNRAVNVNDKLNQDISTEEYVNELLDELEAQKDEDFLKNREKLKEIISTKVYEQEARESEENEEEEPFTGPTTISFEFLEAPLNRAKRYLTIPVYRCEGSALVVVDITVRPDGSVASADVLSTQTESEPTCFIEAARAAALSSVFRSSADAPDKQRARISYQFIAQ